MTIQLHTGDLPSGLDFGASVAVDTETLGLNTLRDRLCVVQLSSGDGTAHLVHFPSAVYDAPNLTALLADRHGLKDLCRDLIGVELSKQQQSSDWGAGELTAEQVAYAASDVLHLHRLKEKLDAMLARENRMDLAQDCFAFLPARARLDIAGWGEEDIFSH